MFPAGAPSAPCRSGGRRRITLSRSAATGRPPPGGAAAPGGGSRLGAGNRSGWPPRGGRCPAGGWPVHRGTRRPARPGAGGSHPERDRSPAPRPARCRGRPAAGPRRWRPWGTRTPPARSARPAQTPFAGFSRRWPGWRSRCSPAARRLPPGRARSGTS